jgi:very-short-patch-repair endonuclease
VADELRQRGYGVVAQLGVAGYFLDLAVRHPVRRGEYVLAVECDGATYHSSRSSRDRDRLRQQQLEELGWTIHRIWSTDWFFRPKSELERLVKAIESAT